MISKIIKAAFIFLFLASLTTLVEANTPLLENLNFETYPEKIEIIFKFDQQANMVFYAINEPPQVIADVIGDVSASSPDIAEVIPINQGQIKRIKVFKDDSLSERITISGKHLYGIDFFVIELNELVDYYATKEGNAYYLHIAKVKGAELTKTKQKITIEKDLEGKREKKEIEEGRPEGVKKINKEVQPRMNNRQLAIHWREVGYRYQKTDNFEKAIECYKKAIELDPEYPCAHNDLGIIYFYLDEPSKSIKEFKKALKIDPNYLGVYTNLAIVYEEIGEVEKALEYWQKRIGFSKKEDFWTEKAKERIREIKNK